MQSWIPGLKIDQAGAKYLSNGSYHLYHWCPSEGSNSELFDQPLDRSATSPFFLSTCQHNRKFKDNCDEEEIYGNNVLCPRANDNKKKIDNIAMYIHSDLNLELEKNRKRNIRSVRFRSTWREKRKK